jgi:hypothetical protein
MSEIFTTPVSAGLLQVLAEAAAGYPNQGDKYFVASYEPGPDGTYNLFPPLSRIDAEILEGVLNLTNPGKYAAFGPFDTRLPFPENPAQQTVQSFEVTPTPLSGQSSAASFPIGGAGSYDAMFCSIAAVTKFAVPYYTQVYSSEFASQVLQAFVEAPLELMVHLPWSEYGMIQDGGTLTGPDHGQWRVEDGNGNGKGNIDLRIESPASGDVALTTEQAGTGIPRWVPAVFQVDENGNFTPQPLYPSRR